MLDLTRYEYVTLGMPNVTAGWPVAHDRANVQFSIHKEIELFVFEAAKKYPMWEFCADSLPTKAHIEASKFQATGFEIFDKDEYIGEIGFDYASRGNTVYVIRNERIEKERERGPAAKTKDLKKAIKILGKKFGAKTLQERLQEAIRWCDHGLGDAVNSKGRAFRNAYNEVLINYLHEYVVNNWETIKQVAASKGADAAFLEKFPDTYYDHVETNKISNSFDSDRGVVVVIHGADYAVWDLSKKEDKVTVYSTNDLPDWIKRGVGMLKLIEKNNLISGVGYKAEDGSFFVAKGEE